MQCHRPSLHPHLPRRIGASLALLACLATGAAWSAQANLGTPTIHRLSAQHYAPTQTVDVLTRAPAGAFVSVARVSLSDPTGTATQDQLVSQLGQVARGLGANAIIVESVTSGVSNNVGFNPAGGQLQAGMAQGPLTVRVLAIRYTR